jgi:hypothetical protein
MTCRPRAQHSIPTCVHKLSVAEMRMLRWIIEMVWLCANIVSLVVVKKDKSIKEEVTKSMTLDRMKW